jgi:methionyl-tRNA formyltransferase
MRILFFGSSSFSVPALKSLAPRLSGVVTRKTKPKGRGYLLEDNEVKREAIDLGLPVVEIDSFKDDAARELTDPKPDLLVVVSFGLIVPRWFLDLPTLGAINVHPSLLPRYRGPSPLQWVIWNGEKETGITIMKMNERMDAGDILFQESTTIGQEEDAELLSDRLARRASEILPGMVDEAAAGGLLDRSIPQDDEKATYTPMITKEMGRMDWNASSTEIVRQVRALVMWPTACTSLEGRTVKVFSAVTGSLEDSHAFAPGSVVSVSPGGLDVAAGQGSVVLKEVQLENRKRMGASDFARGYRQITEKHFE